MASYSIRIKKSAIKELEAIATKADRRRIAKRIESLADEPRPIGAQKLSGHEHYRIRQGRYRILYTVSDRELVVYVSCRNCNPTRNLFKRHSQRPVGSRPPGPHMHPGKKP